MTKSTYVDAPVVNELPMALECRLVKFNEDGNVAGEIVNVSADESVLGENDAFAQCFIEVMRLPGIISVQEIGR